MKDKRTVRLAVLGGIAAVGLIVGLAVYFLGQRAEEERYFYPFDAYIALPEDTVYPVMFAYYHENKAGSSISGESVDTLALVGAEGATVMLKNRPEKTTTKFREKWYDNWELELIFSEKGSYHVTDLEITGRDGSVTTWPIGDWYFEIGEAAPGEYEQIYSNIGVSTPDKYCYTFSLPEGAVLKRMQYGPEQWLEGEALETRGEIPLELPADRISLIRPKLEIEVDGKRVSTYGSHSYSGFSRLSDLTVD